MVLTAIIVGSILMPLLRPASDEDTISVRFASDSERSESLISWTSGDIVYVRARDLALVLGGRSWYSPEKRKLDIVFGGLRVRVSAFSSYVIVEDLGREEREDKILHLPVPVQYADEHLGVPVESLVNLLGPIVPGLIEFDAGLHLLTVDIQSANITGVHIVEKANGTLIQVVTTREFALEEFQSWINKGWLYLTVLGARIDSTRIASAPVSGIVRRIVPIQKPESAQLAFRLKDEVDVPEMYQTTDPHEIVISLRKSTRSADVSVRENLYRESQRWLIDTVVLDPGHGGKDPGSIGKGGLKEKTVVLDIAKRLGKLLVSRLGVRVVYTRDEDVFVPLKSRGRLANREGGKLFISLHANYYSERNIRGFEIYLMRPGKTAEAVEVARRENSVIRFEESTTVYDSMSSEGVILASLVQSAFMKESEDLAGILQMAMSRRVKTEDRGVKQAGFLVLVGASMPNVLVEVGYLSNRAEERLMRGRRFRQRVAEALYEGIKSFREKYEQMIVAQPGLGDSRQ